MDLRLDLDTMTFDDLVELGRSAIPGLAPDWTDHNAHDPGIMLMELVAWIAEAQIYSLSRMRRDERAAYAALLGVTPRAPAPMHATIWPLAPEEGGQPALFAETDVGKATTATPDSANPPLFRVSRKIHVTGAVLQRLLSRTADGRITDQTRANGPSGATYLPFGAAPAPGDSLVLALHHDPAVSKFGPGALSVGIELAEPAARDDEAIKTPAMRLKVSLRDSAGERAVPLEDRTGGLLRSGLLLLDLSREAFIDTDFELILRSATGGFLRTPRVRRIALNVLPVEQVEAIEREEAPQFGEGMPDQTYRLVRSGLVDPAVPKIELIEPSGALETWEVVPGFSACGPTARVFTFDPALGEVTFGNGLNGMAAPAGAALQASYEVTAGTLGAVPAGANWILQGFAATFGINQEAAAGGRDGDTLADLQSRTRQKIEAQVASVTSDDMVATAMAFEDLEVARAFEMKPTGRGLPGTRTLVTLAGREDGISAAPETPEWLAELHARLAPTLPLGQRLRVLGPSYVEIRVTAKLMAAIGADVAKIRQAAIDTLKDRFKVIDLDTKNGGWSFGRSVTPVMVGGWLRNLPGVVRLDQVQLYRAGVPQPKSLGMGARELPQLVIADSDILVQSVQGRASR